MLIPRVKMHLCIIHIAVCKLKLLRWGKFLTDCQKRAKSSHSHWQREHSMNSQNLWAFSTYSHNKWMSCVVRQSFYSCLSYNALDIFLLCFTRILLIRITRLKTLENKNKLNHYRAQILKLNTWKPFRHCILILHFLFL